MFISTELTSKETSALLDFAYKSCCLQLCLSTERHFCFLFCLSQQRQGEKCIPVLKSNKSSLLFRVLNQIKHPCFFLLPSTEHFKNSRNTYYSSPLHHLQKLSSFLLHPHIRILGGRPPKTSKCLFYKTLKEWGGGANQAGGGRGGETVLSDPGN